VEKGGGDPADFAGWVEAQQKEVVCLYSLYPSPLFKDNSNLNLRFKFETQARKNPNEIQ
jgi:hypothetical protein